MTPITTEELLALTKSADLLRQTAEKAMRFDEAERLLTDHIRSWGHLQEAMPEPDINDTPEPLVKRVIRRLNLVDSLKKELEVVGNHAICRLNVLGEIDRVLGSDGGTTGANTLTGVPPQLYRLPGRVEQLVRELNGVKSVRDSLDTQLKNLRQSYQDAVSKIESLRIDKNYAEEQLTHLAKFIGLHGMTWAHVVSEAVSLIERQKKENDQREKEVKNLHASIAEMGRKLDTAVRENETLARNVPPEPPAEESCKRPGVVQVMDYSPALNPDHFAVTQPTGRTKNLGQQWCRVNHENDVPEDAIGDKRRGGWICLCNVLQDPATGALTYRPVGVKDLPLVP